MNGSQIHLENERGVGLIEVLVAMVLLAVGVLGMGLMIGAAIQDNVTSRDNTMVTSLIKRQIESFESADTLPDVPLAFHEEGLAEIYNRSTYLRDSTSDTTIPGGLVELEVIVTWEGQDLLKHSRSFKTYLMDR